MPRRYPCPVMALEETLARRTLELVDIPSVSRNEAEIARYVREAIPLPLVHADGETLVFATPRTRAPLLLLAGHLDTVPPQDNLPGRLDDGVVHGLGASDMKGGLAVMVELARWAASGPRLAYDLAFLFFPREELSASESPLPALFDAWPAVREAALVVLLEPTDNTIQAGCLGHLHAELVFEGVSAHSARPWLGVNAIDRAVEGLRPLVGIEPRDADIGGLVFREVLSATRIHGGIAGNVIPDRVSVELSFRYAPDRSPEDAEAELTRLLDGSGVLTVLSNSPAGRVTVDSPHVERLRAVGGFRIEPKQAWTNVAEFSAIGRDAINLGPGATRYAHKRDEQIQTAALLRTFDALRRFTTA
jgi:succinyl-diaminopimelate desuccinylase